MSRRRLTVRLPFYCEPIVDEHRFGGLVGNAFAVEGSTVIDAVKVDVEQAAHVRLSSSWEYGQESKKGKEPVVSLVVTRLNGQEITWYWFGDGSYDGFDASVVKSQEYRYKCGMCGWTSNEWKDQWNERDHGFSICPDCGEPDTITDYGEPSTDSES